MSKTKQEIQTIYTMALRGKRETINKNLSPTELNTQFRKLWSFNKSIDDTGAIRGELKPAHGSMTKLFIKLYKTYQYQVNRDNLMEFMVYWTFRALVTHEYNGDIKDSINQKRLIGHIKEVIRYEIIREINPNTDFTTRKNNHIKIKTKLNSIDVLIGDNEDTTLKDVLGESSSLNQSNNYYESIFLKWYKENRDSVLTAKHKKAMDNAPGFLKPNLDVADELKDENGNVIATLLNEAGISKKDKWRKFARIKKSVLEVFNKQIDEGLLIYKSIKYRKLKGLSNLLNAENTNDKEVWQWITAVLNDDWIQDVLLDGLTSKEQIKLNHAYQKGIIADRLTLYKVINVLMDEYDLELKWLEERNKKLKKETDFTVMRPTTKNNKVIDDALDYTDSFIRDTYGTIRPEHQRKLIGKVDVSKGIVPTDEPKVKCLRLISDEGLDEKNRAINGTERVLRYF